MNIEKRNLYFQRSNGEHILLSKNVAEEQIGKIINNFLNDHNFKSYYTRVWEKDGVKWYDVGSHTEFFLWYNVVKTCEQCRYYSECKDNVRNYTQHKDLIDNECCERFKEK